jgi:GT2 family glycosyltransferase
VFATFDPRVRVHLGVVTLGSPPRLAECLAGLAAHESRHDFAVSCLVNRDTLREGPLSVDVPDGVRVERSHANVGWSGGLHLLRPLSEAELYVWVQDDMLPEPGWLDALVDAADAHPEVGLFGSLRVGDGGEVLLTNGGWACPPDQVNLWNDTDTTDQDPPAEVTRLEWVTSKGCLTRSHVFDEVGGPDPRLWPLNHVDKDYSSHVRCHGYGVALVPAARLRHHQSQSAPNPFRVFLNEWRDGWFDERWAAPLTALAGGTSEAVDHPCAEWRSEDIGLVEGVAGREASAMLVPFARGMSKTQADLIELRDHLQRHVAQLESDLATSRRRVRHLRRRLRERQARPSFAVRVMRRLRRLR